MIKISSTKYTLRLFSLLTAIVLWFYVLNAARSTIDKTFTVQYILPDHMVFQTKPVQEVTITLEGPRTFMRSVIDREEKLTIDLTKAPYRENNRPSIPIKLDELVLPFGIKAEKVNPRVLNLKLERKITKVLAVKAPLIGDIPSDLILEDVRVFPKDVEVSGPRSVLSKMNEISTRSIEIESLFGQTTLSLDWNLSDERIVITDGISPQLKYTLKARRSNLILDKIPVRLLGEGELVRQREVELILWAPMDIIRRVDRRDLNVQVWAEIPENSKGRVEVELRAVLPPRLHLIEIRPKRVLVEPR